MPTAVQTATDVLSEMASDIEAALPAVVGLADLDGAVEQLLERRHRLVVVGRRVDGEQTERVGALNPPGRDVEEPEHRLEVGVHQQRRQRVEEHPILRDATPLVEITEEFGEFDPHPGQIAGRGSVPNSVCLAFRVHTLLSGDTVDYPYRQVTDPLSEMVGVVFQNAVGAILRRDDDCSLTVSGSVSERLEREALLPRHRRPRYQEVRPRFDRRLREGVTEFIHGTPPPLARGTEAVPVVTARQASGGKMPRYT